MDDKTPYLAAQIFRDLLVAEIATKKGQGLSVEESEDLAQVSFRYAAAFERIASQQQDS